MATRRYQEPYREYTDATDTGADKVLLSPAQQAQIGQEKQNWQRAAEGGDQAGMDAAHQAAERIRAAAGYSGGANGGAYNPFAQPQRDGASPRASSPTWTSPYQAQRDATVQQLQSRQAFSYDPEKDPVYQQYREQYTVEGQRAAQNALAQVATRTGGLASSYAQSASQQAGQYYARQLADKVPELRQLAYQMYMNEGDRLRSDLQMYDSLDSADASRWAATVWSPYQADRAYATDVDNRLYDRGRDALADSRYDRQYADSRADVEYDRKLQMAATMAQFGNFSGYADLWGQPQETVDAMVAEYAQQKQTTKEQAARDLADWYAQYGDFSQLRALGVNTSALERQQALALSGKTGSRGGSSGGSQKSLTVAEVYQMAKDSGGDPRAYLALNYAALGIPYNQITTFQAGYDDWAKAKDEQESRMANTAATLKKQLAANIPNQKKLDAIQGALDTGSITEAAAQELLSFIGYDDKRLAKYGY